MSSQHQKIIVTTWGHPAVNYDAGEPARVIYTPMKFEDFREIVNFNRTSDDPSGAGQVHYQDLDGDWVPIESQVEYAEAVKYLVRAKVPVPLRLQFPTDDRKSSSSTSRAKPAASGGCKLRAKEVERQLRKLQKESGKPNGEKSTRHSASAATSKEPSKNIEKLKLKGTGVPPAWFDKYMQKFKGELLTEVAAMLEEKSVSVTAPAVDQVTTAAPLVSDASTSTGKQVRILDSAALLMEPLAYMDHKSSKLMKKMSKANNSEKKLKKLNSKLEQLELKRSRLLEWNRRRQEQQQSQVGSVPVTPIMDASVLSGGNIVLDKIYASHNAVICKTWRVVNTGTAAWTDKTELRLAYVTPGLKPLESCIECPHLEPGQEGDITTKVQAPDFAGLFESYWHFYHDDVRFGQWMGCAVVVDPKPSESSDEAPKVLNTKVLSDETSSLQTALQTSIKELQLHSKAHEASAEGAAAPTASENRAEYESDPDDNNNVSHSDNDNQSSSDSDDSDDSESFVHVPMPPCYQFHAMPLFNIQPGQEDVSVASGEGMKEDNLSSSKPKTPPTTPRGELDSEEELFEEASGAESNLDSRQTHPDPEAAPPSNEPEEPATPTSQQGQSESPPVRILPETFVTGAINVATRALNATEAIMKSIHGTAFNIPAQAAEAAANSATQAAHAAAQAAATAATMSQQAQRQSAPTTPQSPGSQAIPLPFPPSIPMPPPPVIPLPPPPTTTSEHDLALLSNPYIMTLQDMGFNNLSLNSALLTQHNYNMSQVVAELLSMNRDNP